MNKESIKTFNDNGFTHVQNSIDKKLASIAMLYALINNEKENNYSHEINHYADPLMESILVHIKPIVEEHINRKLLPSYSYYRVYDNKNAIDAENEKRNSDICASVCLGYDYNEYDGVWDFCVNDVPFQIKTTDMLIYNSNLKISRPEFDILEDFNQVHAFFNFIYDDKNNSKLIYDGRDFLGIR